MKNLIAPALAAAALAILACAPAATAQTRGHDNTPRFNYLDASNRGLTRTLAMQDFRGRMKPVDTHAREIVMKITKREHFEGWDPQDLYFSWLTNPAFWYDHDLIYAKHPGVKALLGIPEDRGEAHFGSPGKAAWVSASSLIDGNQYVLGDAVREALRTPDAERSKTQRKLLKFDERFNIFWNVINGGGLRIFPIPGDPNHAWADFNDVRELDLGAEVAEVADALVSALRDMDNARIAAALQDVHRLQETYGASVLPSGASLRAELWLNDKHPFRNVTMPYLIAFLILIVAFFWSIGRRGGAAFPWRHPLYLLGILVYWAAAAFHLFAFVLRWIASGRAPLSNGYESLIFIALATAIAGVIFEFRDRRGSSAAVSAMLTTVVLSVAMLSTFDPAIGPLVPVLASYWLNIHVTVITGSYGFLGLGSLLGALTLLLYLLKGPGRTSVRDAILQLDRLQFRVLVTGLGLLSIGTFLGGVWANESWGRYWGWDPKETWSLVTILVYAVVIHFRWLPSLNRPLLLAAGSFAGIASVVMTYFGVNY
ncbi:cytochrome c biogenesis protein CcsA, partial [bacterium]|nr:cytochrome c biogenesis protein CcsA [bacterium]